MTYPKPSIENDLSIVPDEDIAITARRMETAGQLQVAKDIARLKAMGEPIHYMIGEQLVREEANGQKFEFKIREDGSEEIIGEINDEFDDVETFKKKREGETIVFDGKTSLQDFCAALEIDQRMLGGVSREVKTLSDFIFSLKQGISKTGDQINYEQLTFIVESADSKGIKKVRVSVHEQA